MTNERAPEQKKPAPSQPSAQSRAEATPAAESVPHLLATVRRRMVPPIQRQRAGQQLAQLIGNQRFTRLIQRQGNDLDAGVPLPAGVPDAEETGMDPEVRRRRSEFFSRTYMSFGDNFDLEYVPTQNPDPEQTPVVGTATFILRVHIRYQDFTRAMMADEDFRDHRFTREQMRDFAWADDEREQFRDGFVQSVHDGWSGHHQLTCQSEDFDDLSANVALNVEVVGTPAEAHTVITAQKVPSGAPRLRSWVQEDQNQDAMGNPLTDERGNPITRNRAHLDWRDPTEPETMQTAQPDRMWRVGPFATSESDLTPAIQGMLDSTVIPGIQSWANSLPADQRRANPPFGPDRRIQVQGRTSSSGGTRGNERLGQARADSVAAYLRSQFAGATVVALSSGERGTGEAEDYQRVDVFTVTPSTAVRDVTQNVAAHEAGHMLGLGDEYTDNDEQRLIGDEPSHYGDVEAQLGTDAANDTLVANSGNIMSVGGTVQPGHYVYFVTEMESATSLDWTVQQ